MTRLLLLTFGALLAFLTGYAVPKVALCDLGTEVAVNAPHEYPAYAIECRGGFNVEVLLLD